MWILNIAIVIICLIIQASDPAKAEPDNQVEIEKCSASSAFCMQDSKACLCAFQYSCKIDKISSMICATYEDGRGGPTAASTFVTYECLKRAQCEDDKWTFCHYGSCITGGTTCSGQPRKYA